MIELRILKLNDETRLSIFFENLWKRDRLHFDYIFKAKMTFQSKMLNYDDPPIMALYTI